MEKNQEVKGISFIDSVIYAAGGMGTLSFQGIIKGYYYMFFLTNVMLLPTVAAASIYTSLTLVAIIAMTVSGMIMDAVRLPWGRQRSWILVGNITSALTVGFMFYRFENVNVGTYVIFAIVINFLYNLFYDWTWVGGRAIISAMSSSSADAVKLTTFAEFGTKLAGLVNVLLAGWLIEKFGANGQGYMIANFLMTLPLLLLTPIYMKMTKKYDPPRKLAGEAKEEAKKAPAAPKVGFKDMIKSFTRPAICYYIAAAFACAQTSFFSVLLAYYTNYVLNNPSILGISSTVYSAAGFLGVLITPWLSKKFTNKQIYAWLTLIAAFPYLLVMWINGNPILFVACRFLTGLIATPTAPIMVAIANDVADYNELKGISNARSFVTSMMGTMIRVGLLIASAISSFGLAAVGYDATKPMTDTVLKAIVTMMGWGPAAVCIVAWAVMLLYNVDEKEIDAYRRQKAAVAQGVAEAAPAEE
jgi:Na+/melibiose symporter-like transporter